MGLAENIKRLREQYDLTQEDIAKIAGVSYQAVSSWERGEKSPRMGAVIKLAQHFGLKNSDLIDNGIDLDDRPATIALSRADNPYDDLPEEAQQEIENFIEYTRQKYKKQD